MFFVLGHILGVDKNVVQVDDDADIKKVTEDVVHKTLKSGRGIGKSERHYKPFKRTIMGAESSFPLFSFSNVN